MAESTRIATTLSPATTAPSREFGDSAAVRRRAAAARGQNPASLEAALNRLTRRLNSGEPLDRNAPRGHYLNILV